MDSSGGGTFLKKFRMLLFGGAFAAKDSDGLLAAGDFAVVIDVMLNCLEPALDRCAGRIFCLVEVGIVVSYD